MNTTLQKIKKLMDARGWNPHRLSTESDLPYSSIRNLFTRNTEPTLPVLRSICQGLGISLADFFSDETSVEIPDITKEERSLVNEYRALRRSDRRLLQTYLSGLRRKDPKED